MAALTALALALAAQQYPNGFPGGPVDPWGKTESLTSFKARHDFDSLATGERKSKEVEIAVLAVEDRQATVSYKIGKFEAYTTSTRDVPGSFHIDKERVLELKDPVDEELTLAGKKMTCRLTQARVKVGGVRKPGDAFDVEGPSKEVDSLKVWTNDQIPGGVARFEWVRHPFNLERGTPTRHKGEVTKFDEKLTIGKETVSCCIFTTKTTDAFGGEETCRAWHSNDVPGKVARIETERKVKDKILKEEWVITEITKSLLKLDFKKKDK